MNETPTNQTIRQPASMISWVEEVRGLDPQIGALSAPECRVQRAGRTYSCMPPDFEVEPLKLVADGLAVCNEHINTIILTGGDALLAPCPPSHSISLGCVAPASRSS